MAELYSVIGRLLLTRTPEHHADAIALQSMSLTLVAVRKRMPADCLRGDSVPFTRIDADAVARGIDVILRRLGELTDTAIHLRTQAVLAMRRSTAGSQPAITQE